MTILLIIVIIFALGESKLVLEDRVFYYAGLFQKMQGTTKPWFWMGSKEDFSKL